MRLLQAACVALRLVTNTSRRNASAIFYDLKRKGFAIEHEQLFAAPKAMLDYIELRALRPYCLIHPSLETEFARLDHSNPNAVVVCDAGPFVKALEYASAKTATVLGKPSADFFIIAVDSMGLKPSQVLMVGDDVEADVAGEMAAGLDACLVKTGKYQAGDEVKAPDCRVADTVATLIQELF
ncbi:MAG: ribonucleotide monophosphatase NagD (HAD superfamily) [Bermanella sp.]